MNKRKEPTESVRIGTAFVDDARAISKEKGAPIRFVLENTLIAGKKAILAAQVGGAYAKKNRHNGDKGSR